jgi:hypothetical protein
MTCLFSSFDLLFIFYDDDEDWGGGYVVSVKRKLIPVLNQVKRQATSPIEPLSHHHENLCIVCKYTIASKISVKKSCVVFLSFVFFLEKCFDSPLNSVQLSTLQSMA